jgi:hypothetical protein
MLRNIYSVTQCHVILSVEMKTRVIVMKQMDTSQEIKVTYSAIC